MAEAALSALFDGAQVCVDVKHCVDCENILVDWKPKQKLCASCAKARANERSRVRSNKGVVGSQKPCEKCGEIVTMTGSRQKYCHECAEDLRLLQKRMSSKKEREYSGSILIGSEISCSTCSASFVKLSPTQKYCSPACRPGKQKVGHVIGTCRMCKNSYRKSARRQFFCKTCGAVAEKINKKKYRAANKNSIDESRKKYVENNKEEISKRSAERKRHRRKNDPWFAIQTRISSSMTQALRNLKSGRHWEDLVGYTLSDLMRHLERQFLPGMSWDNREKWHIDHIRPISSFEFSDLNDPSIKDCWSLANLRPLWASDNMSKNDKRIFLL